MGQVASVRTPLTSAQALGAFLAAGCPASALRMVAAQSAVETAGWQKMNGWNAGNVTPSASQIAAGISWMTQNVPNMRYIVYPSAVAGAQGMLSWLSSRGVLPYAEAGDLSGYMGRLQAGCYLGCVGNTDPSSNDPITQQSYTNYQNGIASWMAKLANVVPAPPPLPGTGHSLGVAFLIGSSFLAAGALGAFYVTHGRLPLT